NGAGARAELARAPEAVSGIGFLEVGNLGIERLADAVAGIQHHLVGGPVLRLGGLVEGGEGLGGDDGLAAIQVLVGLGDVGFHLLAVGDDFLHGYGRAIHQLRGDGRLATVIGVGQAGHGEGRAKDKNLLDSGNAGHISPICYRWLSWSRNCPRRVPRIWAVGNPAPRRSQSRRDALQWPLTAISTVDRYERNGNPSRL